MTSKEQALASNEILELLIGGKAEHLDSFIFNARFELRSITETDIFANLADDELKKASTPMGEIHIGRDGASPVVTVYCKRPEDEPGREAFDKVDASLLAKCAETLLRTTYSAIGIDILPKSTDQSGG